MEMEKNNIPNWKARMTDLMKYYVCLCKAAAFIAGAILCYDVVNYNVVCVLATYFTDAFKHDAIIISAALVNVLGGLQEVVVACSWAYSRSFGFRKIIIFSTAINILGLLMLYLSASNRIPKTNVVPYIFACVLIAVGEFGGSSILERVLLDQLISGHENIEQIDRKRAWCRRNAWLVITKVLVFKICFPGSWSTKFWISMCIIGGAGFSSLFSSCFFHGGHPASCTKAHPETSGECNLKKDRETLPPDLPFKNGETQLIKPSSNAGAEAQQKSPSPICSMKQVSVARMMIPMWSTFIVFSMVISTADTFFILQVDSMEPDGSTTIFLLAKDMLKVCAGSLCGWFLGSRRLSRSEQNFVLKLIICVGMIISVICPSLARQVEVQRLKKAHKMASLDEKVPMSKFMAPLFCLWGLMEGISMRGLDEFFNYHVSKSVEDSGSERYNKIPIAMGNVLSAVCVLACKGWFGDTLNKSRLDKYFRMITDLALINLCWFFFVTIFYSTKEEEEAGVELSEVKVEVVCVEAP